MDWLAAGIPLLNQFNQQQTSLQMTREARQWEEDMYNKYNSPSALVRQYNEAGINPALMFGQPTPAAPTETSPADLAQSATGSVTDMIGSLLNASKLEEEIALMRVQRRDYESQIFQREYENALTKAKELQTLKETDWIDRINDAKTANEKAQAAYKAAEAAISEYEGENHVRLGSSEVVALCQALGSAFGITRNGDETIIDAVARAIVERIPKGEDITLARAIGGKAGEQIYNRVVELLKNK